MVPVILLIWLAFIAAVVSKITTSRRYAPPGDKKLPEAPSPVHRPPRYITSRFDDALPTPTLAPYEPEWTLRLPGQLLAIDVETTGLTANDRIVALAIVGIRPRPNDQTVLDASAAYLVFDPGKRSHPAAERVHGWDDWTLRHQDTFAQHAQDISERLRESDLLIAHNLAFDLPFVARELAEAGIAFTTAATFCTLQDCRARGFARAGLDFVAPALGLGVRGEPHTALEDAWLALAVYLRLNLAAPALPLPPEFRRVPGNFRAPPPRPPGALPRRPRRTRRRPAWNGSTTDVG